MEPAQYKDMKEWWDTDCEKCGALVGQPCKSLVSGKQQSRMGTHSPRIRSDLKAVR